MIRLGLLTLFFACFLFYQLPAQLSAKVDSSLIYLPKSETRTVGDLAAALMSPDSSELQTAYNIYAWITHNIAYDLQAAKKYKIKKKGVKKTLKSRKGICYQYSDLFNALCQANGISSKEILGYSRGMSYFEGDTFYEVDHSWNSVKIDSVWYLLDPTWGSGYVVQKKQWFKQLISFLMFQPYIVDGYKFVQMSNPEYFCRPATIMLKDHLPANPYWQMVYYPISVKTFESVLWSHYIDQKDSIFQKQVPQKEYDLKFNKYEFLPNRKYYHETADLANIFNGKNYLLKATSYFNNISSLNMPVNVQGINEAYEYVNMAKVNAKKAKAVSRSETNATARLVEDRIKRELTTPVQRYEKHVVKYEKQCERKALRLDQSCERLADRINSMKLHNAEREPGVMIFPDKLKNEDPFQVLKNLEALETALWQIDSLFNDINLLDTLILEQSLLMSIEQSRIRYAIDGSVEEIGALRSKLTVMDRFSRLSEAASELNQSINLTHSRFNYFDSLRAAWSGSLKSLNKSNDRLIKTARVAQSLVQDNLVLSGGKINNIRAYEYFNQLIDEAYHRKIRNYKREFDENVLQSDELTEYAKLFGSRNRLIRKTQKTIEAYKSRRLSGIEFRHKRTSFYTDYINSKSKKIQTKLADQKKELIK